MVLNKTQRCRGKGMSLWIRTSAYRALLLTLGVLFLSGAAMGQRSATAITVTGAQTPNPVVAGNAATYGTTARQFSRRDFRDWRRHLHCYVECCAGLPTGATASFNPTTVTASGSGTQNTLLTVSTTSGTAAGTYTFTAKATNEVWLRRNNYSN